MIVKNESKIIRRLLESVAPWIDSYCICDTGSTDDTMEVIQTFFESRQIPGRICQEPFRDFGYNRSFALKECEKMGPLARKRVDRENGNLTQYALLLDADMVFWVNPTVFPTKKALHQMLAKYEAMSILQGTDQFNYKNVRIVKCGIGASYWGVTHEYMQLPAAYESHMFAKHDVFIRDIGDGGAKADKFERDIRLLKQGLVDSPDNTRYTFYLANSLRDHGDTEEAIAMYTRRIALGGWVEEQWYSYYSMGVCYMRIQQPQRAICAWMEGVQCFPERLENLYEIIHYYRSNCKYVIAQRYYAMVQNQLKRSPYEQRTFLFMHRDVYDYKLDYEMTVMGYYCNPDHLDLAKLSMKVLQYPALPLHLQQNVLSNYKFYVKPLTLTTTSAYFTPQFFEAMTFPTLELFFPSTPSMVQIDAHKVCVVIRYVNYRIDPDSGCYITRDTIETRNWIMALIRDDAATLPTWSLLSPGQFATYDCNYDGRYVGIEDVRLWTSGDRLCYNGTRGLPDGRIVVETGDIVDGSSFVMRHHLTVLDHPVEKNWVRATSTHMVYSWHPLTVVTPESPETRKIQLPTPSWFQHVRGSCNAVAMDNDELWFLCHVVSYESRRYYYHLVVMLDATTFALRRYTRLFTFEQPSTVEYALGFIYEPSTDEFLVGYSVMDRRTEFRVVTRQALIDLCIEQTICDATV